MTELLEQAIRLFQTYSPWLVTELHLMASALLPIYAGAHASLSRPLSAAKPSKKKTRGAWQKDEDSGQKMEGLSPWDAISFPLIAGAMLTGLYYLIKWLQDPTILNKIINGYISLFGLFAIAQFLTDAMNMALSFLLPSQYRYKTDVWEAKLGKKQFISKSATLGKETRLKVNESPWPGPLAAVRTPMSLDSLVWHVRRVLARPLYVFEIYVRGAVEASVAVGPLRDMNNLVALCVVLYYNFVDKPWWLTNLFGLSLTYGSLQLMSPTTFWTGTLILSMLFFYDIYFVFFTPIMITVATKLEAPIKLLIPRPADERDDPTKLAVSMLGLGDIVVPGMMMGLALRFDLFMFYMKKQRVKGAKPEDPNANGTSDTPRMLQHDSDTEEELVYDTKGIGRAVYKRASGNWGERFWLGRAATKVLDGCIFPKPYFYASVSGYIVGMMATLVAMHISQHGQPALLYLVPTVLGSLWGTAFFRGEIKSMWNYSELEDEDAKKEPNKLDASKNAVSELAGEPREKVLRSTTGIRSTTGLRSSGEEDNNTEDNWNALKTQRKRVKSSHKPEQAATTAKDGYDSDDSILPSFTSYESLPISRPTDSFFTVSIRVLPMPAEARSDAKLAQKIHTVSPPRHTGLGGKNGPNGSNSKQSSSDEEHVRPEHVSADATPARNTRSRRTRSAK